MQQGRHAAHDGQGEGNGKPYESGGVALSRVIWDEVFAFGSVELGYDRRAFGRLSLSEFTAQLNVWNRKQDREERRFAALQALTANLNRDSSRHPKPYTVADFMPRREAPKPVDREAANVQALSLLRGITQAIAERNPQKLDALTTGGTP